MEYGQFCPIAKASEIVGEKWTILIIRELLMGSTRFNQLQRGLGLISPTILTKRLAMLVERGMIIRKRIPGQRGFEYHPTEPCKELLPILEKPMLQYVVEEAAEAGIQQVIIVVSRGKESIASYFQPQPDLDRRLAA